MNLIPVARQRFSLVRIIIAINTLVFLAWVLFGLAPGSFMEKNFLVSWTALSEGRPWLLITSVFSHATFLHFFINMFVLNSFGTFLERFLGPKKFLRFYLMAGIMSSLAHCIVSAWIMKSPDLAALGASGAISGLVLLFCLLFPKEKILFFALIPVPALTGAFIFIGIDLWGLFEQTKGGGLPIGHGAHLGGAATGIIYYYFFLRPRMRRA